MAKHKGPPHEEHADESWLIPYSDLMTLLLALFIVLFASSAVDEVKYERVMEALAISFGAADGNNIIEMSPNGSILPLEVLPAPPQTQQPESEAEPETKASEDEGGGMGEKQMDKLYASLERYITDNSLGDNIGIEFKGENVLITLKSDIWFQSGSAAITRGMVGEARTLAALLRDNQDPGHPLDVVVTGHTDNIPIHTSKYPSNWYLSMERAFNFLAVLLANGDLDPRAFSARGYGEYHPIASNGTPEGRQANRRVELLVSGTAREDQER
jgi:chemotaxis protein MotB